jgi:small-conductance mechanosensitive channel
MVLIAARPFRVGDRVRLQAGALGGNVEGAVVNLGLLYTTIDQPRDPIMVPNNMVLAASVVPLRAPAAVELRARLRHDVRPTDVQALLDDAIGTDLRTEPHVSLEEIDSDEVVVLITATPVRKDDGPRLADEVLAAVAPVVRDGDDDRELAGAGSRA